MNKKAQKHWVMCDTCYQLVYTTGPGTGNHRCPKSLRAKREAELDMAVDEEMSTFEHDIREFWNSSDVKFWQFMLDEEGKI